MKLKPLVPKLPEVSAIALLYDHEVQTFCRIFEELYSDSFEELIENCEEEGVDPLSAKLNINEANIKEYFNLEGDFKDDWVVRDTSFSILVYLDDGKTVSLSLEEFFASDYANDPVFKGDGYSFFDDEFFDE